MTKLKEQQQFAVAMNSRTIASQSTKAMAIETATIALAMAVAEANNCVYLSVSRCHCTDQLLSGH